MREKIIIPAIIAKTQNELDSAIRKVVDFSEILQLDIMDGKFVPNSSIDFDFDLPSTGCTYEAHLMIANPVEWIDKNWSKTETILVHFESCKNPEIVIEEVKDIGRRVGLVLNPETPARVLSRYIKEIDQVLVMTVNPGFYGSPFLPETLNKVREIRKMRPDLDIEVDGGINAETIKKADLAGANMFVSGSYIMNSENPKKAIETLKKQVGA